MNRPVSSLRGFKAGFTLIELLVAIAILAIVVVIAFQIIGMAGKTVTTDNKKIDGLTQARQALDRFGLDWNARVVRDDVPVSLTSQSGNDSISFVSRIPAPTGDRAMAVVEYQLNTNQAGSNTYKLERGALGFNWNGTSPTFTVPMTNLPALQATNRQTLSPGIFRLKYALLTKESGTTSATLTNGSTTSLTNLAAVVVGVAVIDDKSRKLLSAQQLQSLAAALPDPPASNPDPLATWQAAINSPDFATKAGIPPGVVPGVRVYQRYFYVLP